MIDSTNSVERTTNKNKSSQECRILIEDSFILMDFLPAYFHFGH